MTLHIIVPRSCVQQHSLWNTCTPSLYVPSRIVSPNSPSSRLTDIYHLQFPKDPIGTKLTGKYNVNRTHRNAPPQPSLIPICIVGVLFVLETLFSIFLTMGLWDSTFARGWGDIENIFSINWLSISLSFLNGLSRWNISSEHALILLLAALIAQTYYLWRLWKISSSLWFPLITEAVTYALQICIMITHKPFGIGMTTDCTCIMRNDFCRRCSCRCVHHTEKRC
jgi:hypothetical protein